MADGQATAALVDAGASAGPLVGALVTDSGGARQPHAGLRFSVEITNTGDTPVALVNPYEGVAVEVADASGAPRALPAPPRAAKTGRWQRALDARERYVRLVGCRVDGVEVPAEGRHAPEFELPAGAVMTLDLQVDQLRSAPGAHDAVAVTPGRYGLQVLLPLRWRVGDAAADTTLRSAGPVPVDAG